MKSLGQQFIDKMTPRLDKDRFSEAALVFTEDMVEEARRRSANGESLPNGKWNNTYGPTQAKKHGRDSPVTLRDTGQSMRGMSAQSTGRGANIKGSEKLRLHDTGKGKGGKVRQLFPRNINQIPLKLKKTLMQNLKIILNGK